MPAHIVNTHQDESRAVLLDDHPVVSKKLHAAIIDLPGDFIGIGSKEIMISHNAIHTARRVKGAEGFGERVYLFRLAVDKIPGYNDEVRLERKKRSHVFIHFGFCHE